MKELNNKDNPHMDTVPADAKSTKIKRELTKLLHSLHLSDFRFQPII